MALGSSSNVKQLGVSIGAGGGALDLLEQGNVDMSRALEKADAGQKPRIYNAQANIFRASAEQYSALRAMRIVIEQLEERTRRVWETLIEEKPELKIPSGLTEFLQDTTPEKTDDQAIDAYSEALVFVGKAIGEEPQTEEVWKHHYAQADVALSFAKFLHTIGRSDDAKDKLVEAASAIENALTRHPARKKKTLLRLQEKIKNTSF